MSQSSSQLRERVLSAAENALKHNGSVGPLELLQELGFLYPGHVIDWRKGVPHYTPIEPHIQCGAPKLAEVYRVFAEWAAAKGMQTVEAEYSRRGVGGVEALQVTVDGDDERERFFRLRRQPDARVFRPQVRRAVGPLDRKSTRLNSSHLEQSRMPSSA